MSNTITHSTTQRSATEVRAMELLGSGLANHHVAAACGVTEGRISQLLADPQFAEEVSTRRFQNLQAHSARDANYDELEDAALAQLKMTMPMIMNPMQLLKALQVLNGAKRRGATTPDVTGTSGSQIVSIQLPVQILQNFTVNINNQVIQAGTQELLTVQSGALPKMLEAAKNSVEVSNGTQSNQFGQNDPRIK